MESKKITESWMDTAACEALGATTPQESAAYQQELASAGDDARRLDQSLRDTVARLAAASPHMSPSADLRGRILQATAPTTFKMEDYRKATRDTGRFYRWGFYAAMLFLMAGAYYNIQARAALTRANAAAVAMAQQGRQLDAALKAFVSPDCEQVTFVDGDKVIGRALVNEQTHQAVVILPKEMIPEGKTAQLTLPRNGKDVAFETVLITAPANTITAPKGRGLETVLNVKTILPDTHSRTSIAGQ